MKRAKYRNWQKIIGLIMAITLIMTVIMIPVYAAGGEQVKPLRVMSVSDSHIINRDMCADTEDFRVHFYRDMKLMKQSEEVMDHDLETAKEKYRKGKLDVLIFTGDLTKDGELLCNRNIGAKLNKFKQECPGLKVYVVPGNHDINNKHGVNFNTASGKCEKTDTTNAKQFEDSYGVTYNDETVKHIYEFDGYRNLKPRETNSPAGALSYVAHPMKGYTFIGVDSGRYSVDSTKKKEDEHMTSGEISPQVQKWVTEQAAAAREKGDVVILLEHHALVPHFDMVQSLIPAFVLNDYENVSAKFADAGVQFAFTGHLHSQDVAMVTTEKGNKLYDIETGSAITYPCPTRVITFENENGKGKATGITEYRKNVEYTELDGSKVNIPDLTEYSRTVTKATPRLIKTKLKYDLNSALGDKMNAGLKNMTFKAIDTIVDDICDIQVTNLDGGHGILDYANAAYQTHLYGDENASAVPREAWFIDATANLESGNTVDKVVKVLINELSGLPNFVANAVLQRIFPGKDLGNLFLVDLTGDIINVILNAKYTMMNFLAPWVNRSISYYCTDIIDSLVIDTNFTEDNNFVIENGNGFYVERQRKAHSIMHKGIRWITTKFFAPPTKTA